MMQRVIYLEGVQRCPHGVGLLGQIDLASRRCSAARMGVGRLVTRHFCAKLAVQAFCSSPPGNFLNIPRSSWLFRRLAGYAVMGRSLALSLCSPWTAPAFAAPLRCEGGWGNDNSRIYLSSNNSISVIDFG